MFQIPADQIGGAVVLFLIALRMVFPPPAQDSPAPTAEPLIVPLAIPMIAGGDLIEALHLRTEALDVFLLAARRQRRQRPPVEGTREGHDPVALRMAAGRVVLAGDLDRGLLGQLLVELLARDLLVCQPGVLLRDEGGVVARPRRQPAAVEFDDAGDEGDSEVLTLYASHDHALSALQDFAAADAVAAVFAAPDLADEMGKKFTCNEAADIVALMQHFTIPEVLAREIARTRGPVAENSAGRWVMLGCIIGVPSN